MAILDTNKYYYFRLRNGQPYAIKESLVPINTNIMHNYQELTAGQIAFYLEHPAASIAEIVKCPAIAHGETLEIGIYVTESKARITSRIL